MKKAFIFTLFAAFLLACGGGADSGEDPGYTTIEDLNKQKEEEQKVPESIKEGKGIGETTKVVLNDPLDQEMVESGKAISEMKCAACHRFTDMRVVGPGWAGITSKRKPEWIMNMITNVEMMLDKDPEAQKLLEECLTRMPNQNLTVEDARDVLEFMYQNDLDQAAK